MNALTPAREAARLARLVRLRGVIERACAGVPAAQGWQVSYDRRLLRLERRVDALIAMPGALMVVTFRPGAVGALERRVAEDAALDISDFLSGADRLPVQPVLLTAAAGPDRMTPSLLLPGVAAVRTVDETSFRALLHEMARHEAAGRLPPGPLHDWDRAEYRPVPTLAEAACTLFRRHGAAELLAARDPGHALNRARAALSTLVGEAGASGRCTAVFLTGVPGAGKTLCGLDAAFAHRGAFFTGNPTLVHVLRDALVRDAVAGGAQRRAAHVRMRGVVQELRDLRDEHLLSGTPPPEAVLVIDEAQRCWDAPTARHRSRDRSVHLDDSEAGHLLDIAGRRPGTVLICLVGGGQEIHDGEGGLREWGRALAGRPHWRVVAPPDAEAGAEPDGRQRLGLAAERNPALHLPHPLRAIRADAATAWVDAVLADDPARARSCPLNGAFRLTRSLADMRAALRTESRGLRRAGLVCSAQGKRLRAEGFGHTLPHMDPEAVARWFNDRAPDLRSAGALEVPATEFAVQGLELDTVGLCWDTDLLRGRDGWRARLFRGNAWTVPRRPEALANRLNAYRVLLTRARHGTIIWVPRGDPADPTRAPADFDAVADFLLSCGAAELVPGDDGSPPDAPTPGLL